MKLLDLYIEQCRTKKFEWLKDDCLSFSRGWAMLVTGKDPTPEYLEAKSLIGGLRVFKEHGGYFGVGGRFGERIPPLMAHRGDIVLCLSGARIGQVSGYTYGVCTGDHIALPSLEGLGFLEITEGKAAWRLNRSSVPLS